MLLAAVVLVDPKTDEVDGEKPETVPKGKGDEVDMGDLDKATGSSLLETGTTAPVETGKTALVDDGFERSSGGLMLPEGLAPTWDFSLSSVPSLASPVPCQKQHTSAV